MVAQVGCSVVGQSGGRVMLCVVCTVHEEMSRAGFLVGPQHQGRQFVSGLASKPLGRFLPVCPQNWCLRVYRFGPQNRQLRFDDLGLKITVTVSWFGPPNQVDDGLSVAPQNQRRDDDAIHASRSDGLLRLQANHVRVFQSGLKTSEGVTTGGACGIITKVASIEI
jgi:hypothetical protein